MGKGDLLSDEADGSASIEKLPDAMAPAPTRGMSSTDKRAWLDGKKEERAELTRKISEVAAKRGRYLRKNKLFKADSFDDNVGQMLEDQAGAIGVSFK